jgi:hypothetical protein
MIISINEAKQIAKEIAGELYKMGDTETLKCNRMQFMAGTYPDGEEKNGGVCKGFFAGWLTKQIVKRRKLEE